MSLINHISSVFALLNERAEYAVLRNYEGLPERNESRDIDIIITKRSFREIKRQLVERLCCDGWKIVTYLNSDRLITFVSAKNIGQKTEIVQWDFFVNTSVWGVELMAAEEFVAHRVWNGFLWHVDVAGEFLDKYLYNRAVGAKYPLKYERIRSTVNSQQSTEESRRDEKIREQITDYRLQITDVSHGDSLLTPSECLSPTDPTDSTDIIYSSSDSLSCYARSRSTDGTDFCADATSASSVNQRSLSLVRKKSVGSVSPKNNSVSKEKTSVRVEKKLSQVFGCGDMERCDVMSGKRLLLRAVWWNMKRRPLGLLRDVCAFLYTFVRNYLRSRTGFAIGFTGPDGVGKTTVIESLIDSLGAVFRTAHAYMHFRPMLFGNLGEVAHSAGLKREVDRNYDHPHRGGRVGVLSSLLRLLYYSVDYIVGYWLKVKSQTRITRLVIFDRYYTDVICDSRRSRIFLNYKFLYWFGRVFVPRLDYNILLTARTETILARKQELTREGIEQINERIEYLAGKKGYKKVLNETTAQEAVMEILEYIFEEQHKKNLKRLNLD